MTLSLKKLVLIIGLYSLNENILNIIRIGFRTRTSEECFVIHLANEQIVCL